MELIFKPEIFTPLFFKILDSPTRFVLNYGGKGSGKSVAQAQLELIICLKYPNTKTFIFRKQLKQNSFSTLPSVMGLIKDWGIQHLCKLNQTLKKLTFVNGSEMIFLGLDDSENLKSLHNPTRIWIEEASQILESDFHEINSRIRGITKVKQQITLTFNPISEKHWIKRLLVDTPKYASKTTAIKTVCRDNRFIGNDYIEALELLKEYDYDKYRVDVLGEWGTVSTGAEIYNHFKESRHIFDNNIDPNLPLHISFDENYIPYLTLLITQIKNNVVKVIDEITIPDKNLEEVCNEFLFRYSEHTSGLFIHGDSTSMKRDVKLDKNTNFYTLIMTYLSKMNPVLLVPKSNPNVAPRTGFINKCFFNDTVKIEIHSKCLNLINDLKGVKRNSEGGKDKKTITNHRTNSTYQEFGHTSDALEYLICQSFQNEYNIHLHGNIKFEPIIHAQSKINRW